MRGWRCSLTARKSLLPLQVGVWPFCEEFACSLLAWLGFLWVLQFPHLQNVYIISSPSPWPRLANDYRTVWNLFSLDYFLVSSVNALSSLFISSPLPILTPPPASSQIWVKQLAPRLTKLIPETHKDNLDTASIKAAHEAKNVWLPVSPKLHSGIKLNILLLNFDNQESLNFETPTIHQETSSLTASVAYNNIWMEKMLPLNFFKKKKKM